MNRALFWLALLAMLAAAAMTRSPWLTLVVCGVAVRVAGRLMQKEQP